MPYETRCVKIQLKPNNLDGWKSKAAVAASTHEIDTCVPLELLDDRSGDRL